MDPQRPRLHALVGWYREPYGLIGDGHYVSLEDAVDYHRFGASVLVDPADEYALAAYERAERAGRGDQVQDDDYGVVYP